MRIPPIARAGLYVIIFGYAIRILFNHIYPHIQPGRAISGENKSLEMRNLTISFLLCLIISSTLLAQEAPRIIHVFVPLADNQHQEYQKCSLSAARRLLVAGW